MFRMRHPCYWSGKIAEALEDLIKATDKGLVIIDEAQQTVETDPGLNTMSALKAAREAINQAPGRPAPLPPDDRFALRQAVDPSYRTGKRRSSAVS